MQLDITLPWPPSANVNWQYTKAGVRSSAKVMAYRRTVLQLAVYTWPKINFEDSRIAVTIKAFPPDKRRHDLDNLLKVTLDGIQKTGVFKDDSQIDRIIIERGEVIKHGSLDIRIEHFKEVCKAA